MTTTTRSYNYSTLFSRPSGQRVMHVGSIRALGTYNGSRSHRGIQVHRRRGTLDPAVRHAQPAFRVDGRSLRNSGYLEHLRRLRNRYGAFDRGTAVFSPSFVTGQRDGHRHVSWDPNLHRHNARRFRTRRSGSISPQRHNVARCVDLDARRRSAGAGWRREQRSFAQHPVDRRIARLTKPPQS